MIRDDAWWSTTVPSGWVLLAAHQVPRGSFEARRARQWRLQVAPLQMPLLMCHWRVFETNFFPTGRMLVITTQAREPCVGRRVGLRCGHGRRAWAGAGSRGLSGAIAEVVQLAAGRGSASHGNPDARGAAALGIANGIRRCSYNDCYRPASPTRWRIQGQSKSPDLHSSYSAAPACFGSPAFSSGRRRSSSAKAA